MEATFRPFIILLEPDVELQASVGEQITRDDAFTAAGVGSIGELNAMLSITGKRLDALMLSTVLPDGDAYNFCALLQKSNVRVPMILLADKHCDADLLRSFAAGACDYLVKPVRPRELLARLQAHLRSFARDSDATVPIGPYLFQFAAKVLHEPATNRRIWLTAKEAGILKLLYLARGGLVSRQALLDEIWGYNSNVTTHTLETHVYRLRQRIEPDPGNLRLLLTERGGYRLAATTSRRQHAPDSVRLQSTKEVSLRALEAENADLRRMVAELTRGEPIRSRVGEKERA